MSEEIFESVKINTHVLKVHVHCHGCVQKVKKLLHRIKGVYEVIIDAEEHKVTVSGTVDSSTLIRKLAKSGKIAKLWPSNDDKFLNQMQNSMKTLDYPREADDGDFQKYLNHGLQMEFLKGDEENSLEAETKMGNEFLGWDEYVVKHASIAENGMNSTIRMPVSEYCYPSPVAMNNKQGQPYPILIIPSMQDMHYIMNMMVNRGYLYPSI